MTLLVSLWLAPGADAARFEAFEREAQRILARHGGEIAQCWRPVDDSTDAGRPFEVQVVRFANRAGLAAYQADPDVLGRASERAAVIGRTEVLEVADRGYLRHE